MSRQYSCRQGTLPVRKAKWNLFPRRPPLNLAIPSFFFRSMTDRVESFRFRAHNPEREIRSRKRESTKARKKTISCFRTFVIRIELLSGGSRTRKTRMHVVPAILLGYAKLLQLGVNVVTTPGITDV